MKNANTKNLILFFIFLGLTMLFAYFEINIHDSIDNTRDLTAREIGILKVLFTASIFLDIGFFISTFWNLYKFLKTYIKYYKNKME